MIDGAPARTDLIQTEMEESNLFLLRRHPSTERVGRFCTNGPTKQEQAPTERIHPNLTEIVHGQHIDRGAQHPHLRQQKKKKKKQKQKIKQKQGEKRHEAADVDSEGGRRARKIVDVVRIVPIFPQRNRSRMYISTYVERRNVRSSGRR